MRHALLATALTGFWLVLSGIYTPLLLGFGALSVALVLWLTYRLDQADGTPIALRPTFALLRYLAWLAVRLVKANIEVSRRILDPRHPVKPVWQAIDTRVDGPLQKTLYANSITLTPDTLVTNIPENDRFMVHALWPESITWLREGEMQRRVRQTGI